MSRFASRLTITFFAFLSVSIATPTHLERAQIVVAADGSGNFTSIQAAINSIPKNNSTNVFILIKKGVYHEKLFIEKSFLTLVGEDQDSTRIVYAELRQAWNESHNGSDWGAAVLNIDSAASDITIANLTIHNDYGSLHNDPRHQFAIRGNGTRIRILYCNVIADGADTISLWNRAAGMYYHANCYFEGWVDYVCPRGWCYITDSRFFGHNLSASIWHDGSENKDEKFVIRYSSFDGVPGFPLGRHHRDAQIFLLDCIFSRTMADKPIYLPVSPNSRPWQWSARHYFYNCHRVGGDYAWFRDNLSDAAGAPKPADVNAKWTFDGKWDPEGSMPAVLPFVSFPSPRDGSYEVPHNRIIIHWTPSRNADATVVRFGREGNVQIQTNHGTHEFDPGPLDRRTRYDWQIDEIAGTDTLRGPIWHFTTD